MRAKQDLQLFLQANRINFALPQKLKTNEEANHRAFSTIHLVCQLLILARPVLLSPKNTKNLQRLITIAQNDNFIGNRTTSFQLAISALSQPPYLLSQDTFNAIYRVTNSTLDERSIEYVGQRIFEMHELKQLTSQNVKQFVDDLIEAPLCKQKLTELNTVIQGLAADQTGKATAIHQHASALYQELEALSRTPEAEADPRKLLHALAVVVKALPTATHKPSRADIDALIALGEEVQGHPSSGLQTVGKIMIVLGATVAIAIGIILTVTTVGLATPGGVALAATGIAGCVGVLAGFGFFAGGKMRTGMSKDMVNLADEIKNYQTAVNA